MCPVHRILEASEGQLLMRIYWHGRTSTPRSTRRRPPRRSRSTAGSPWPAPRSLASERGAAAAAAVAVVAAVAATARGEAVASTVVTVATVVAVVEVRTHNPCRNTVGLVALITDGCGAYVYRMCSLQAVAADAAAATAVAGSLISMIRPRSRPSKPSHASQSPGYNAVSSCHMHWRAVMRTSDG